MSEEETVERHSAIRGPKVKGAFKTHYQLDTLYSYWGLKMSEEQATTLEGL